MSNQPELPNEDEQNPIPVPSLPLNERVTMGSLQELIDELKSPNREGQQKRIVEILNKYPPLMRGFIKHRKKTGQKNASDLESGLVNKGL